MSAEESAGDRAAELACDVAHEVGNLVAAVRLQAHLLDAELSARELASASLGLDALSGRAGALLGLLRPLLTPDRGTLDPVAPGSALDVVRLAFEEEGTRGRRIEVGPAGPLPAVELDPAVLQALLRVHLGLALEAAPERGAVRVSLEREGACVVFRIEDEGRADEALSEWRSLARRGRPLACAVASEILARRGGACEAESGEGGSRVWLRVACAGEPGGSPGSD